MKPLDPGQTPMSRQLARASRDSADIAELIGLCKGVLADGTINQAEAEFIKDWLDDRSDTIDLWPARELHQLLGRALADGVLTTEDEEELIVLLEDMTGERVTLLLY